MKTDPIVTPGWLAEHISAPDLRVIDATWFLPGDQRNAKELYETRRIPGAIFFDIDEISDTDSELPHMLPSPEKFASRMKKFGIGDGCRIVVYGSQGLFSAARVWWTFRVMGHEDVAVLDGGFPAWERGGYEIETGTPQHRMDRHSTPLIGRQPHLRMPTLAAVDGMAAGAGASLALACDLVVASQSAAVLQAFSKIGLFPHTRGTWVLPPKTSSCAGNRREQELPES